MLWGIGSGVSDWFRHPELVSASGGGSELKSKVTKFFNWGDSECTKFASCTFCEGLPVKCDLITGSELSVVDKLFVYKLDSGIAP